MKHGSNKNLIIVLSVVLAVLCVGTTFAWLAGNKEIECDDMQGSIITQYFHCGTGTEDDPFVITRPIHYYNLIYLYQRKEGFADENYHFQLGYDIGGNDDGVLDEGEEWLFYSYDDEGNVIPGEYTTELNMAGYSDGVLPIGTSATPFNAIFQGNSLTVKNLKVISFQTINKVDYNTCDIGLFGFIGPNAEISDVYYKNVTIDLTGLDPTTVNHEELHNDDIHEGEVSYVGVIAGHIVDSAICDRVYINDCTILGGAAAKCEFGYFGVVENAETGAPSPQLVESIKELRGAGSNAGFGGSIDMQMLYNRLTAIHNKAYNNGYKYLSSKNKYVDEVTGDIHYEGFVYNGTLPTGDGYYSPTEGNFIFSNDTNGRNGRAGNYTWTWHYVSGLNTATRSYPVASYVYTIKEDPDNPGKYLKEYGFVLSLNGYYLALDENGNFVSTENESEAQVFIPEDEDDLYLYTRFDGEVFYLAPDGTDGLRLTSTRTKWGESDEGEIYTTSGGFDYYVYCDVDGNWSLTRKDAFIIDDDAGDYLYVRAGNVNNTTNDNQATRWFSTTGNLSSTGFFYPQNGTNYYLGVDNGDLTVKTTNTVWTADENGYYTTVGGEKFYLICDDGDWKAVTLSETYIYDANGNYLSTSATPAITNAYSDEDATPWIVASNGSSVTIAAVINGTKYYLGNNNGTLTLTTTPTNWVKNGNSYYTTVGDIDYYLTYSDGAWRTTPLAYQIITDNNGHYLLVTNNAINNGTQANATHFYFENPGENPSGRAYCIVNGTTYYLRNNNGTLQTTTNAANATSWNNTGSSLSENSADGNYTYALRYNNGWSIQTFKNGKYITDGKGNYLQLTSTTAFTNTTNIDNATVFTIDSDGRIHATVSGWFNDSEVYLRNNNNTFELTTTQRNGTQWTIGTDNISNGNYYLVFDNGSWKLSTSTIKKFYTISAASNGTTYYMGANGTTLTAVTDPDDALAFSGTSGVLSTEINGATRYLNITTANPPVLSLSNNSTNFTNSGNRLYISSGGRYYAILLNNGVWGGTRDRNTTSGTVLTFTEKEDDVQILYSRPQDYVPALPSIAVNDILLPAPELNTVTIDILPNGIVEERTEDMILDWSDGELLVVEKTAGPNSYTGTYFPLRTELHDVEEGETYSGSDPYGVSPENTGYIIAGNYETSGRRSDIRVSQYSTNDIRNSYNGNLTTVYTNDADGRRTLTAVEMQDEYYVTARDQFLESIDGTNIYGLHFMNSEISMNHLIEAENVKILHKAYQNYQFPEDCIDFRTVEPGFISFFGGTYYSGNDAFFSLHEIFRNEDKTISAIYEIKLVCAKFKQVPLVGNVMDTDSKYLNIYHDPVTNTTFYIDASGNHVPYTDGMTLPDNYQIVFDTDWITNPTNIQTNAVYYFHIPCNIGEFALGSVKGKTGAYLMYLDIGTNGGDIYQTIVSTAGNAVTDKFNVDVRDAEDNKADYAILQIATDVPECASDDYSIKISFDESNKGPDNVHFKGLYTIEVVNNTGEELTLYALLCDDDDDLYDDYGYAYELIYTNGDHTETVYANEITALEYWQMAAGFVIPASGAVTEVDYMALAD